MVTPARPLTELFRQARRKASGEFICASPVGEIHVFLQGGRVAWATDSRHPCAFAAHLQRTTGIEPETFRDVVHECRRRRRPLGETLVEWGLASWARVRESLLHQIGLAIGLLSSAPAGQVLFLERSYHHYSEELTFDLDLLLSTPAGSACREELDQADEGCRRCLAPAQAQAQAAHTPSPSSRAPAVTAERLRSAVEGLSWAEVLEGERLVEADPGIEQTRVPLDFLRATLRDGADFAALRAGCSSLVGLALEGDRSIWCRVAADTPFGSVVSAVWLSAPAALRGPERPAPRPDVVAWSDLSGPEGATLLSFLERAPDVLGAALTMPAVDSQPIAVVGNSALERASCLDILRRRGPSLSCAHLATTDVAEAKLESIGYSLRSMVTGEGRLWCYGAELDTVGAQTLWLFLDRRSPQGLGWAYLTALGRALARGKADAHA